MSRLPFCAAAAIVAIAAMGGCYFEPQPKQYGVERPLAIPGRQAQVWAVAPAINLSGHREVDPILQSDLLFQELQQVRGMTAIPVNRVAQVYAGLGIRQVETAKQATLVCELLQADALLVPTVTYYDPYSPPKMGVSLALFRRPSDVPLPADGAVIDSTSVEPAELSQAVGIFDAEDGSVRADIDRFAAGRSDPNGPMAEQEFLLSMDAYSGFVYHQLIANLLGVPAEPPDGGRPDRGRKSLSTIDESAGSGDESAGAGG